MEMMYNGALVMPNNYAVVNEEEMTYVDGGWAVDTKFLGLNLYLTHKECNSLATKGAINAIKGALSGNIYRIIIGGALGLLIPVLDKGYGLEIKVTTLGLPCITGISALSKKEEKNIAKKNKII